MLMNVLTIMETALKYATTLLEATCAHVCLVIGSIQITKAAMVHIFK